MYISYPIVLFCIFSLLFLYVNYCYFVCLMSCVCCHDHNLHVDGWGSARLGHCSSRFMFAWTVRRSVIAYSSAGHHSWAWRFVCFGSGCQRSATASAAIYVHETLTDMTALVIAPFKRIYDHRIFCVLFCLPLVCNVLYWCTRIDDCMSRVRFQPALGNLDVNNWTAHMDAFICLYPSKENARPLVSMIYIEFQSISYSSFLSTATILTYCIQ